MKKLQVKIFTIPLCGDSDLEEELNRFLQTRQIVTIDKGIADRAWNFCVTYVETRADAPTNVVDDSTVASSGMKDYGKILTEDQFALYLRLHRLRNQLAKELSLPKTAIFRNAELSQMSISRCSTLVALQKIPGVGAKKAQKYGEYFLRLIAEFSEEENANAKSSGQDETFYEDGTVSEPSVERDGADQ